MSLAKENLLRKIEAQDKTINVLQDKLDLPAAPASGPDAAYTSNIPAAGPRDFSEAQLKKQVADRDALIAALREQVRELKQKKQ
jgi:hypothetical protein